jgi:hypothetical protein
MMAKLVLSALAIACLAHADIIDRIAVSFDHQVITQSELLEEIRVVALLNGVKPDYSAENKRKTAERLIDQRLLRREMEFTRQPIDPPPADEELLKSVPDLERALQEYGVNRETLVSALRKQWITLRFIDQRFGPEVDVSELQLMSYIDNICLPERRKRAGKPQLTAEEVRGSCEEELRSQFVEQRVEDWVEDARSRLRLRFEEDAFR